MRNVSSTFYSNIERILYGERVTLSEDYIINLALLGESAHNDSFKIPLIEMMNEQNAPLTLSKCYTFLSLKRSIHFDIKECSTAIEFISRSFESQKVIILKKIVF